MPAKKTRLRAPPSRPPDKRKLEVLRAENLASFDWLTHGFSTRAGGVSQRFGGKALNLGFTQNDAPANVQENRRRFLAEVGKANSGESSPQFRLVELRQTHSAQILFVNESTVGSPVADGMVTDVPGLLLGIQTADCLPVLVVDPENKAVGAFHAGWRGTLARIVEKGVGEMRRHFGSRPSGLIAAIGPAIHVCCYAVGKEVQEGFAAQFAYAAELFKEVPSANAVRQKYPQLFLSARPPGHSDLGPNLHLDLVEANRRQLLEAGLLPANVSASPLCTACRQELLFSYRATGGNSGRHLAVIGIAP